MLKQHQYYVYYDGNTVMARMDDRAPVTVQTYNTPQEAHDAVQEIVNPDHRRPDFYGPRGYISEEFQKQISPNCETTVRAAYGDQGEKK